jgi:hypothetical protein
LIQICEGEGGLSCLYYESNFNIFARNVRERLSVTFLVEDEFEDNQRGNQNPYIEEEQTTQWPKEKVQKDKQRSTKHTYKSKDRVTHKQTYNTKSINVQ